MNDMSRTRDEILERRRRLKAEYAALFDFTAALLYRHDPTYSADVTSTQDQAMQLEYRCNSRWSVSGVRDQNGGFGATVSFQKIF
jgi:hypothetical protein